MAIKQVSVETEIDVKEYTALTTDPISTYPTDCLAGSLVHVLSIETGKTVAHVLYDGSKWNYVKTKDKLEDSMFYSNVNAIADEFTIDMEQKRHKKVEVSTFADIAQSEEITVDGAVTVSGNINITITSSELEADEIVPVAVLDTDTLDTICDNIALAINSTEALETLVIAEKVVIEDPEEVEPTVYKVIVHYLTAGTSDSTFNIALSLDDAEGLTPVATSTAVTSGLTTTDKTFVFENVPTYATVEIMVTMDGLCDLIFPEDFIVSNSKPQTYAANTIYEIKVITMDGGATGLVSFVDSWTKS